MHSQRRMRMLLGVAATCTVVAALAGRELPARTADGPAERRLEPSRLLAGSVLHESDALGAPTDVEVLARSLVIADDFAEHRIRLLSRSDGRIERSFGGTGRGPREFESAWSIDVIDPAGRFLVHDVMLQRLTWVDLARDFDGDRWVADRSVQLGGDAMLMEVGWSGDGLVAVGVFPRGRLAHLDRAGALLRTTGATPLDRQEVPPEIRMQAYQSKLEADPSRTRWAVATRYADRLEIYDRDGTPVAQGTRPYGFEPVYQARRDGMASGADTRFGYLDLTTTDARIYALFSGRTRAEGRANYGRTVHVFDWNGALLDVLELDTDVIAVAVDPAARLLYGLRHDPSPAVLVFELGS